MPEPLAPRRKGIRLPPLLCNASQQLPHPGRGFAKITLVRPCVSLDPLRTTPWNAARAAARPSWDEHGTPTTPKALTAAERVIAAELQARGEACDALSMMVSSVARMVQAGRCSENRWNAG